MDTRTGMMPVCAVILVSVLTVLSIRAWQGADLSAELSQLANNCSIDAIDRNMAELRQSVRAELGLEAPTLAIRLPGELPDQNPPLAMMDDEIKIDPNLIAFSDQAEELDARRVEPEVQAEIELVNPFAEVVATEGLLAINPLQNISFAKKAVEPVRPAEPSLATELADATAEPVVIFDKSQPVEHDATQAPRASRFDHQVGEAQATEEITKIKVPAVLARQTTMPRMIRNGTSTSIEPESKYPQWTIPTALITELESLFASPLTNSWANSTIQILEGLGEVRGISDPNSKIVFQQLNRQVEQLDFLTVQVSEIPVEKAAAAQGTLATQLRQVRYSILRRLAVWPLIHELSLQPEDEQINLANYQVGQFLLASNTRLNTSGIEKGWSDYLQIGRAASAFNSIDPKSYTKKKAARFVLARLFSPSLSTVQQQYLRDTIDQQTVDVLRISAIDPVDLAELAKRLERLETRDSGASAFYLNDVYQSLFWSDNAQYHELAGRLQTHYRNANFRVSVSEELLNRMMPQLPDTKEPYRDRFMGADLVGQNKISNTLGVNLIPDPNQISIQIVTDGRVKSHTTATKSGVVIENEGTSRFRIIKRLAFGQQGVFAYRPETTSQVAQRVVGLRSNLDNVPAVGWLVRKIAKNKIAEQAPASRQYAKNQLETKAEEKFEQEIESTLSGLERTLTNNLLHPLIAMDLEPDPVQISTTADRINMRYRLAGRDQMAAHTARPRAIASCLMSMQIHESVINNFVSRFDLAGKKFTTSELIAYINEIMGQEIVAAGNSKKKQAELEFAPFDPIRFDFTDNKIQISLNLKSFKLGSGKKWKNLNIRASYNTQVVNGFNVALFQGDEKLKIKGRRMNVGDKLAVGLICEVLFPEQMQVALMPQQLGEKLRVSNVKTTQFVVSNGWIGISVDDVRDQRVQSQSHSQTLQQADSSNRLFNRIRR